MSPFPIEPGMEISGAQVLMLLTGIINLGGVIFALIKLGRAVGRFEFIGEQQALEIKELKDATKQLSSVITDMAVQSNRQDNMEERQNRMAEELTALRRGEGWILPHELINRLAKLDDR